MSDAPFNDYGYGGYVPDHDDEEDEEDPDEEDHDRDEFHTDPNESGYALSLEG